jgi:hypothetical protein
MLWELQVVEQRYRAVQEVLDGGSVTAGESPRKWWGFGSSVSRRLQWRATTFRSALWEAIVPPPPWAMATPSRSHPPVGS